MDTSTEVESMQLQENIGKVEVPEDVEVEVKPPAQIKVKGRLGELSKDLSHMGVKLEKEGGAVIIRLYGKGRRAKSMMGTAQSIIRNMITGVTKGYTYKMKIISSHFPMNVKVQGGQVIIENFIGERWPRRAKIIGVGTKVEIKGDDVIVKGIDKESVGQTAANIEQATKITGKDLRKFLDGIYVYERRVGME